MICGSAPIAANVKDFLRVALDVRFVEGYGLSETAAAASICHPDDVSNFHVGMPCMYAAERGSNTAASLARAVASPDADTLGCLSFSWQVLRDQAAGRP